MHGYTLKTLFPSRTSISWILTLPCPKHVSDKLLKWCYVSFSVLNSHALSDYKSTKLNFKKSLVLQTLLTDWPCSPFLCFQRQFTNYSYLANLACKKVAIYQNVSCARNIFLTFSCIKKGELELLEATTKPNKYWQQGNYCRSYTVTFCASNKNWV